jgi:hypothetical protein
MALDVALETFSAVQLVLSMGITIIAFNLSKTFEGGIFEKAWQVIQLAPIVYALAQAVELWEATYGETQLIASLASIIQVCFLVTLLSGFFMFASAWGRDKRQGGGVEKPVEARGEGYASAAKGAMVFILGRNGASKALFYTGEPNVEDFESRLHGVLGNGASTVLRHMAERAEENKNKKEA